MRRASFAAVMAAAAVVLAAGGVQAASYTNNGQMINNIYGAGGIPNARDAAVSQTHNPSRT